MAREWQRSQLVPPPPLGPRERRAGSVRGRLRGRCGGGAGAVVGRLRVRLRGQLRGEAGRAGQLRGVSRPLASAILAHLGRSDASRPADLQAPSADIGVAAPPLGRATEFESSGHCPAMSSVPPGNSSTIEPPFWSCRRVA
jgi:hypothetical protein